jgi:hypothetical protein
MVVSIFVQNGINPIHLLVYDLIDYDFRVDSFFHIIALKIFKNNNYMHSFLHIICLRGITIYLKK